MRMLALVVLAAACGGGSRSPAPKAPDPAPVAADPTPAPTPAPDSNMVRPADAAPKAEAKAEPAPPPPRQKPSRDRLRDEAGEVPGMPGWNRKYVADKTVCGEVRVVVSKGKRKLDADQLALSKVFALAFPTDLNFSAATEKSKKTFEDFVENMKKVGEEAVKGYEANIKATDPAVAAGAAARIAQVSLQTAQLLARAPIPKDVRTGEAAKDKIEIYCDKMEEVAEPLVIRAEEALTACANLKAPDGWYTTLCARASE